MVVWVETFHRKITSLSAETYETQGADKVHWTLTLEVMTSSIKLIIWHTHKPMPCHSTVQYIVLLMPSVCYRLLCGSYWYWVHCRCMWVSWVFCCYCVVPNTVFLTLSLCIQLPTNTVFLTLSLCIQLPTNTVFLTLSLCIQLPTQPKPVVLKLQCFRTPLVLTICSWTHIRIVTV